MVRTRWSVMTDFGFLVLFTLFSVTASPSAAQGVDFGAKVYAAQKCSICHAVAGAGNKRIPLDGVGDKLTADQIREWLVAPEEAAKKANSTVKPPMKSFANLSKADLDALVQYLTTLTK